MRSLVLSLLFVVIAAPSFAADRQLADFYGAFLGHGAEEAAEGAQDRKTRFSQVIIRPAAAEKGFTIEWATLKLKGDELPLEADTKSYTQTFRATENPNVYRATTSDDDQLAETSWAVIKGDTLSITQITVERDGGYFVAKYDRTLTAKGMNVHFTRIENSRVVRTVKLSLLKGPAKVN